MDTLSAGCMWRIETHALLKAVQMLKAVQRSTWEVFTKLTLHLTYNPFLGNHKALKTPLNRHTPLLGIYLGFGFLFYVTIIYNLMRNFQTISPKWLYYFAFPKSVIYESSHFSHSQQHLLFSMEIFHCCFSFNCTYVTCLRVDHLVQEVIHGSVLTPLMWKYSWN